MQIGWQWHWLFLTIPVAHPLLAEINDDAPQKSDGSASKAATKSQRLCFCYLKAPKTRHGCLVADEDTISNINRDITGDGINEDSMCSEMLKRCDALPGMSIVHYKNSMSIENCGLRHSQSLHNT